MFSFFKRKKTPVEQPVKKAVKPKIAQGVDGFSDRELVTIYNTGEIRNLAEGDFLFKQGDMDSAVYLIQSGSVRVIREIGRSRRHIATLKSGEWVGEMAFINAGGRTASIVAREPTFLLRLTEEGLGSLTAELQLVIFKNLNRLASRRTAALYDKSYLLAARTRYLANYLKDQFSGRQTDYESSELIQEILEKIPRLPLYKSQLLTQLLDEKASTDRLIEMASTDSSLVSNVLKTINSSYYNLPSPIADFRHAVIFLGFNQIYQLVLKNSIQKSMPDTEEFRSLHTHSNLIALVSYEISLLTKRGKPMVVSTTGLLHDIGKSVMLLLKGNNPRLAGLIDTLNHARLGALLLRKWEIPATIHQSVEFLRTADFSPPADIPEDFRDPVAILHLAHLCNEYLTNGTTSHHPGDFTLDYVEHLGFKEQPMDFVRKRILPVLKTKQHTYPEEIRQVLKRGSRADRGGDMDL